MIMKGGFQIVGALDQMIPPVEPWDHIAPKGCGLNVELSDWVEHVTKQLINDAAIPDDHHQTVTPGHHDHAGDNYVCNLQQLPHEMISSIPLAGDLSHKKRSHDPNWNHHHDHDHDQLLVLDIDHSGNNSIDYYNPPTEEIKEQQSLISLMTHLLESAVAISVDNLGEAHRMLLELTQMASPYAASSAERVVAYFAKAMSSRVVNSWIGICHPLVNHRSIHVAVQVFNNISPFTKFAHFTSNQAILEAFHRCDRVHIIDLDIMQGLQWPALFHILATRAEGSPHVRMTGLGSNLDVLMETGKNLSSFAKRLGLSFEFQPIAKKFGDVDVSMVHVRHGEAVAVHWLRHSLYDAVGPDWKAMRILQQLTPRIITLVEPEMSLGGSFLDRFVGSLHFYSTVFDSLGAYLGSDDPGRYRVEHCLLHQEINNILAIGGPARSGEEKFRSWRNELVRAGFGQVVMSSNSMAQAQLILNMFPPAHGYSLGQGDGTLKLGWKETSLYTASAWTSHVIR